MKPLVSICIPAYKRAEYLKRLLNSVVTQTFRDFEVVITDDSNDASVAALIEQYKVHFPLVYKKNPVSLGSPENWNQAIRNASGEWIKMMHDDDWFTNSDSLGKFAEAAAAHPQTNFIFSGFCAVGGAMGTGETKVISETNLKRLLHTPLYLFRSNYIGHPSTTLIRNTGNVFYDKNLKWLVDIEFYVRYLQQYRHLFAIREPIISIGINEFQITHEAFRNPDIEIPEMLYLYQKLSPKSFRNVFVYDFYWRFIRNLGIRSAGDIEKHKKEGDVIPALVQNMIKMQARLPVFMLKNGLVSKPVMFLSYLTNR